MADQKLRSVYGVVELNNIAGVRTGELVSQYDMANDVEQLENGMLVAVDHFKGEVKLPKAKTDVVYLHASVEKLYNGEGRKHFVAKKGSFLPRCYKLKVGDTFETNAVIYDDSKYANLEAIKTGITDAKGYGIPDKTGFIRLVETKDDTEGVILKAVALVSLPNGEMGIKFRVIKGIA